MASKFYLKLLYTLNPLSSFIIIIIIIIMIIKTHGSVSCGPRNLGHATNKCVFYRSKENAVFKHL